MSVDPSAKKPKRAAEVESASDEDGWLLEASDDEVMDVRYDLDKRLAWIEATATRIAPLVKAQFRRALVQDKELRRRRARLLARVAEQKVIPGGIGTGVITGQAWIPALPTLVELEAAKASTLASFKVAMAGRAYSRVTALDEQLVAIVNKVGSVERQQVEARVRDEAEEAERLRPAARAPWDRTEGAYVKSDPLLFNFLAADKLQPPGGGGSDTPESAAATTGRGSRRPSRDTAAGGSMAATAAVGAASKGDDDPALAAMLSTTRTLGRSTGKASTWHVAHSHDNDELMSMYA
jgi:hypothetical protein